MISREELFLAGAESTQSPSIPKQRGEAWIENAENKVVLTNTIERTSTYTADVPSYPTENGNEVSDSVIKKPLEITTKARVKRSFDVKRLTDMYVKGDVCRYHSPNYGRDDMVISRLAVREHAEVGNEWEIEMTLKQVWTTAAQIVEIDETAQAGETNTQNAETVEESSKTSDFEYFQKAMAGKAPPIKTAIAYQSFNLLTQTSVGEAYMDFCIDLYDKDSESTQSVAKSLYDIKAKGSTLVISPAFTTKFVEVIKKTLGIGAKLGGGSL